MELAPSPGPGTQGAWPGKAHPDINTNLLFTEGYQLCFVFYVIHSADRANTIDLRTWDEKGFGGSTYCLRW